MYGTRARIGYTSPLLLAEVFIHEFYMVAPKGVTLVLATGTLWQSTRQEVEETLSLSMQTAREMGKVGVSLVVLGGIPINLAHGFDKVDELIQSTERECGVPVTTSVTAQINALRKLNARKIGIVQLGSRLPSRLPRMTTAPSPGSRSLPPKGSGPSRRSWAGSPPPSTPASLGRWRGSTRRWTPSTFRGRIAPSWTRSRTWSRSWGSTWSPPARPSSGRPSGAAASTSPSPGLAASFGRRERRSSAASRRSGAAAPSWGTTSTWPAPAAPFYEWPMTWRSGRSE